MPLPPPPHTHQGGSSKSFAHIKKMMFTEPTILHSLLSKLADNITEYCCYQVWGHVCVCGAAVVHRDNITEYCCYHVGAWGGVGGWGGCRSTPLIRESTPVQVRGP